MELVNLKVSGDTYVVIRNLVINEDRSFSLSLELRKSPRGKIYYRGEIYGMVSLTLYKWLTKTRDFRRRSLVDGEITYGNSYVESTGFKMYLASRGIDYSPGILSTMIFKGSNNSENYYENPFRISLNSDGFYLTLVNHYPAKVTIDNNGKKIYKKVGAYLGKQYFIRFVNHLVSKENKKPVV